MAMSLTLRVCRDIMEERARQENLKAAGKFTYSCADAGMPDVDRLAALMEEVGEAATALLILNGNVQERSEVPLKDLRKELLQVAAVATAWCEYLDVRLTNEVDKG